MERNKELCPFLICGFVLQQYLQLGILKMNVNVHIHRLPVLLQPTSRQIHSVDVVWFNLMQ